MANTAAKRRNLPKSQDMNRNQQNQTKPVLTEGWLIAFFSVGVGILGTAAGGLYYLGDTLGGIRKGLENVEKGVAGLSGDVKEMRKEVSELSKSVAVNQAEILARLPPRQK